MNIGATRHLVTVRHAAAPVPDGDGNYTRGPYVDGTPPTWHCAIQTASARELERFGAGTVIATATHLIRGRYRPDVTTSSQLVCKGRTFSVISAINVEQRDIESALICQELT